jgi:hypothetical protein
VVRADGELERARVLLREAIELDSQNDVVLELIGHVALRVAPHDSLEIFRRVLERYRWAGWHAPSALDAVACLLAPTDPPAAAILFGAVDTRGMPGAATPGFIE